ncbi:MAG: PHP domain-containing protein [Termitinemataceae bacterium]
MKANLHLHSRISDGTEWPQEIAERAYRTGLSLVALTDHDSLAGVVEFQNAAEKLGLTAVPAVEIDCIAPEIEYKSELLAYFPVSSGGVSAGRSSCPYQQTQEMLLSVIKNRYNYVRASIQKAQRHFVAVHLRFDDFLKHKRSGRPELPIEAFSFSKVDLFLFFKSKGIIDQNISYRAFKKAYLETGLLSGSPYNKLHCQQVVETVHADGGLVVLPHFGHEFDDQIQTIKTNRKRFLKLLDYFVELGIDGIELYWYRNEDTIAINKLIAGEAKKRNLFLTYGSDCHGPGSGKETMNEFYGDMSSEIFTKL